MPAKKSASKPAKAKKAIAKKSIAKKSATKKTAAAKLGAIRSTMSKTEMFSCLAQATELSKKQVSGVIEQLSSLIERHIQKGGAGEFKLPGLLKINVIHKPATKARKGVNPFTGEPAVFKAKPARNVIKVRALKKLKEMAC